MTRIKIFLFIIFYTNSTFAKNTLILEINNTSTYIENFNNFLSKNKNQDKEILFKKGVYKSGKNSLLFLFHLSNQNNIKIDGQGSTILLEKPFKSFILLKNSNNIIVKNFTIKYLVDPFLEGKIINKSRINNTITLNPKNFSKSHLNYFSQDNWNGVWSVALNKNIPGRIKANFSRAIWINHISEKNNNLIISLQNTNDLNKYDIDDNMVIVKRRKKNRNPVIKFSKSKNLQFNNITGYGSPAGFFVGSKGENITIENCNVLIQNNSLMSSNGDAIHLQNYRKNISIKNNFFEGIMDDIINIYSRPISINYSRQQQKKLLTLHETINLRTGDSIEFFDLVNNDIVFKTTILNVDHGKILLKNSIPDNILKDLKNYQIYDLNISGESTVIKNNIFKNSRRHGICCRGPNWEITNNTFIGLGGNAIITSNLPHKPEGAYGNGITITKNIFDTCGIGYKVRKPCISMSILNKNNTPSKNLIYKNINIQYNNFINCLDIPIKALNLKKFKINNNLFECKKQKLDKNYFKIKVIK